MLFERLLERGVLPVVGLGLAILFVVYKVFVGINEERRIQKLGGHAHKVKTWLPGGIDLIYRGIKQASQNRNLQFWDNNFLNNGHPDNPYTVEAKTGGLRVIFTADPENIKAILATQFSDYGKGEQFHEDFWEFLGDSIFNTDHGKWQHSRALIRPQFVKDRVSDLETFERHVQVLIDKFDTHGPPVDIKELFFRYTLDAATDFLLGRGVGSLDNAEAGISFADAFGEIQRIQNLISRAGPFKWLVNKRGFRKDIKTVDSFIETYIEDALRIPPEELEKRSSSESGYSFLHALAATNRDRKFLRDQIMAVLLGGRDTTACTLSWTFYELSRNPQIVQSLRNEIERVVGWDRPPTYADLKSMKYLQHTMNETLRLYPVVPFNVRSSLKDTTLPRGGGPDGTKPVGVLKGTPIGYSTHLMQLTEGIYPPTSEKFPPPSVYAPHRWEHWQPKSWTYIPFNGGPRICVGQQFALTEMGYTIVRVLQRFSSVQNCMPKVASENPDGSFIEDPKHPWARPGNLVSTVADNRQIALKSDIVLQPASEVMIAFK